MKAVAALEDGSVVVAGYVNGTWNGVASLGLGDFAAVKLDSEGTKQWSWRVSGHPETSCSVTDKTTVLRTRCVLCFLYGREVECFDYC